VPDYDGKDPVTGYFLPGNRRAAGSVGGGNPNTKRMGELKRALLDCGSVEAVQELYRVLMDAARDGDVQAAKLLLDHLVGRPSQAIELTGSGGDPVRVDMASLTAVLLSSLEPFPDAKYAAARALRGLGRSAPVEAQPEEPISG
jgi:hypothetical protein